MRHFLNLSDAGGDAVAGHGLQGRGYRLHHRDGQVGAGEIDQGGVDAAAGEGGPQGVQFVRWGTVGRPAAK